MEYTRVVIKSILGALALRLALGRSMDVLCVQPSGVTAVEEEQGRRRSFAPDYYRIDYCIVGGGGQRRR